MKRLVFISLSLMKRLVSVSSSLSVKLTIGFAIVLLIFSAVAVFNYSQLSRLTEEHEVSRMYSERQQTALALKNLVQEMDSIASGYLLSGKTELIEQYHNDIPELERLTEAVGASAATRDQRNWRSRLAMVSQEFVASFEHSVEQLKDPGLTPDRRQQLAVSSYNGSQIHKQVIFELVESFYDDYSAADIAAREQLTQLIHLSRVITLWATAAAAAAGVSVAVIIILSLTKGVRGLRGGIERVQAGDLSQSIRAVTKDELGRLSDSFDASVKAVRGMLQHTLDIATSLQEHSRRFHAFAASTRESNSAIVQAMEEIAVGASRQAEQTEASVAAIQALEERMDAIFSVTKSLLASSEEAKLSVSAGTDNVHELKQSSQRTEGALRSMTDSLRKLESQSLEIANITNTINEISMQTNILALNAAIESARAGEHGRGFSVIAEEVRLLSLQSSESSKRIEEILSALRKGVQEAVRTLQHTAESFMDQQNKVEESGATFLQIAELFDAFDEEVRAIGDRVNEAKQKQSELAESVQVVASVAQQTAASVQQTAAASEGQDQSVGQIAEEAQDIHGLAESLFGEINKFKM